MTALVLMCQLAQSHLKQLHLSQLIAGVDEGGLVRIRAERPVLESWIESMGCTVAAERNGACHIEFLNQIAFQQLASKSLD